MTLQVRMRAIGLNVSNGVKTVILEPVRDGGNFLIPELCQVDKGEHISGRLTLTYGTPQAEAAFDQSSYEMRDFILTLSPTPVVTPEQLKEAKEAEEAAKAEPARLIADAWDAQKAKELEALGVDNSGLSGFTAGEAVDLGEKITEDELRAFVDEDLDESGRVPGTFGQTDFGKGKIAEPYDVETFPPSDTDS